MSKLIWKSLLAAPAALGAAIAVSGSAYAAETAPAESAVSVDALEQVNLDSEPVQLAQITSVNELSDVLPSDWAYQALQNLVETYGCIQGYPDRTFRGNRNMTRYEFAAGLNACLDVIAGFANQGGVSAEDLAAIRRLQEEFQAELNTLRGRVDALEADVAELEANQFSTTTKLRGQVDFHVGIPFETLDGEDSTTFTSRARLNFDTSFTGEDRLRIRLQGATGGGLMQPFGGYANSSGSGGSTLNLRIDDFYYSFPVGNRLDVILAANSIVTDDFVTSTIVPFDGPSVGDPGGPQFYDVGMGGGAGAGFSFALTDNFVIDAGYSVATGDATNPDIGIFQGSRQSYIGQISYLGSGFQVGAAYLHGDGSVDFNGGTAGAVDTFAGLINFDFGGLSVGGYGAYSDFEGGNDFNWLAGVTFADLFLEGSSLGIYGGQLPQYAGRDNNPFYVEGYYEIPFNEFLTITPAVVYGDANFGSGADSTGLYGVIRTTFRF
jgi:hypothetical protein